LSIIDLSVFILMFFPSVDIEVFGETSARRKIIFSPISLSPLMYCLRVLHNKQTPFYVLISCTQLFKIRIFILLGQLFSRCRPGDQRSRLFYSRLTIIFLVVPGAALLRHKTTSSGYNPKKLSMIMVAVQAAPATT
jgi:hypothetical protein